MLYGITLPILHSLFLPTPAFLLSDFLSFSFHPLYQACWARDFRWLLLFELCFPLVPDFLTPSFCQSICPPGLFFLPTSNCFLVCFCIICSILVLFPLTSVLLLLLIISAQLIWFDNVPDLLTGIWLSWAWLVGNVLFNDKVYCITEIKMFFFISRKLPVNWPLSMEKQGLVVEKENVNGNCCFG